MLFWKRPMAQWRRTEMAWFCSRFGYVLAVTKAGKPKDASTATAREIMVAALTCPPKNSTLF
jgi:hypothetical protein